MFTIRLEQAATSPGMQIRGTVGWEFSAAIPRRIEVRLIWYTEGKGDRDFGIAAIHKVAAPGATGESAIAFTAPRYPNSFSGRLVSVRWAVEAIAFPGLETGRHELVIGPGGNELTAGAWTGPPSPAGEIA